jgi:hypothetical protein
MVKFEISSCSVMICVSDLNCMRRCEDSFFPCILFDYKKIHPVNELLSLSIVLFKHSIFNFLGERTSIRLRTDCRIEIITSTESLSSWGQYDYSGLGCGVSQ